jgi:hypothetical protein
MYTAPVFASAPEKYAQQDENIFRNADAQAFGSLALWVNSNFVPLSNLPLSVANGGTGLTAAGAAGSMLYALTTTTYTSLLIGTAGQVLTVNAEATAPAWADITHVGTLSSGAVPWSLLTSVPTSVAGYGITDVYTKTTSDGRYDVLGAAAAVTPTTLGLVIGTNVLAYRTFGTAANSATSAFDVAGAAAAVTPTTLGLVIGVNVLAYRTFGTAANSATTDFDAAGAASSVQRTALAFAFFAS